MRRRALVRDPTEDAVGTVLGGPQWDSGTLQRVVFVVGHLLSAKFSWIFKLKRWQETLCKEVNV